MKIIAKRTGRCAYPPTGKYIGTPPAAKSFEQHEIPKIDVSNVQLRPDGARQPETEARILSNIVAVKQGRAPITLDPLTSAWR